MKKQWMLIVLLCISTAVQAKLTLQLESTKVQMGQPFRLVLTVDNGQNVGVPDLTPLRQDFSIVGTERSMNYSLVNGQARSLSQWVILLMPKRTGTLTIPPLKVGQEQSLATTVEVSNEQPAPSTNTNQQDVVLATEISENEAYVNQQVIYTVKLFNDRPLLDAEYQAPTVEDALLIPLGDGQRYQTLINGTPYAVEELKYAIFPQKSGQLTIKPPAFRALLAEAVPQRIAVQAKPTILKVKAVPASLNNGPWLPASQVKLIEDYDQASPLFKQGDTLVRTITVQAVGTAAQLMPALNLGHSDQFNIYPEKPMEKTVFSQQNLVGTSTIKVTYLFDKAGKITIPAFKLPWFNTLTGRVSTAELPAKTLEVKASGTVPAAASTSKPDTPVTAQPQTDAVNAEKHSNLAWWLVAALTLGWLLTIALWWFWQSSYTKNRSANVYKKLRTACLANDAEQSKDALIAWANGIWPTTNLLNLGDITKVVRDTALKKHINQLSYALYNGKSQPWRGEELLRAVHAFKPPKVADKNTRGSLPPINPT